MEDKYLDRGGNCVSACLSALLELLYKALGQRVHLIQVKCQPTPQVIVVTGPYKSGPLTLLIDDIHSSRVNRVLIHYITLLTAQEERK